ncbi:striatin isoform X2 [Lutzomyia longipalpis]|uniref:striatin isoform X2 n=1 Tax=Lutzomyia longipalpis TaxID=7200 RepID=UPI002483C9F8|nr:striatin isoform X2 [Lutzomyia longipalpis]
MRITRSTKEMDENSSALGHQNGGGGAMSGVVVSSQMGGNNSTAINNKGQQQQDDNQTNPTSGHFYTIPGILHFIQHEWARFEHDRSQWDVDRAELQARIAVLLGERKSQESLKSDLVRRIKMLEYALRQERAKYHRLKFGCDPPTMNDDIKPPSDETAALEVAAAAAAATDTEAPFTSVTNITWRQGRQLLRQYLLEIGYTETILDVRANRVRSLLGLNNNAEQQEDNANPNNINGRRTPAKKAQPSNMTEAMILDSEAAVMANFDFLSQTDVEMSDDDEIGDDLDLIGDEERKRNVKGMLTNEDDVDAEAEEVLNELNMLTGGEDNMTGFTDTPSRRNMISGDEDVDSSLGLGELAQLTVNNEAETAYDGSNTKESYRKTWNAKYTLRSHFDGVRALAFHPQEPVLITASEDHTLKLWNLQKTVPAKKSASLDVEPLYTFRAHSGPVICLAMSTNGEQCYSGGLDSMINVWNLPNSNIDPYDSYDPTVLKGTLEGHTDAIWGLAVNHTHGHLVSSSADGTVKLWAPQAKTPLLKTYTSDTEGIPTSVDFVRDEADRIVVAYPTARCVIYDTETGKPIVKLEQASQEMGGVFAKYINRVISHPLLPVTITAHEDRHIRFWDNTSGTLVHSMVAHLDAVTSLAIDSQGLYLLSGSHDSSIRLWNLDNKTCVQEITAHRKKFDESILDVSFHPSRPYIASAGADALAKVFV